MMANPVAHFAYTGEAIRKVAECFGSVATVAPFQLKTGDVQIVEVAPSDGIERTRITFWPSLNRVDASNAAVTVVFTDVESIDIVGTVEVQFRRRNGDYLIVAFTGKVIVKA